MYTIQTQLKWLKYASLYSSIASSDRQCVLVKKVEEQKNLQKFTIVVRQAFGNHTDVTDV